MAAQPKEHIIATLLSRAHSPTTASAIFRDKVQKQPLLLKPSSSSSPRAGDPKLDARAARRLARQHKATAARRRARSSKPRPLSARQKRALGVHDIPAAQRRHAVYVPLHRMWCGYVREVLGLRDGGAAHVTPMGAGPMLASADFHGAGVEVVRSRCVGRVGIKGIVVKDTKFTFEIITARDELKVVPKEHTVFRFEIPLAGEGGVAEENTTKKPLVFELHGEQFQTRAPDRANKKFRAHFDPNL
ncbi:hypothetical protein MBLNU459_g1970t1 [Dothideomycetes sp. NU459]